MKTCNQCHRECKLRTIEEIDSLVICTYPECPNYGVLQLAAEDMPKENNQ